MAALAESELHRALRLSVAEGCAWALMVGLAESYFIAVGIHLGAGAVAWRFGRWRCFVAVQLVGIQLGLSALRTWRYLFTDQATINGSQMPSDVGLISDAIGGPYWMWGALILIFNLAILYGAYRLVLRRLRAAKGEV